MMQTNSNNHRDNGRFELLSLALDCTLMVSQLSQSLTMEASGDHDSAVAQLKDVEAQINNWVDELESLKAAESLDKENLLTNLQEAKNAVEENIRIKD